MRSLVIIMHIPVQMYGSLAGKKPPLRLLKRKGGFYLLVPVMPYILHVVVIFQ